MRAPGRGAAPGGGAPAAAPSRPPGRGGPPGRGPMPGRPPMGGRPPGVGAVRVGCMGRRSPARIGGREPGAPGAPGAPAGPDDCPGRGRWKIGCPRTGRPVRFPYGRRLRRTRRWWRRSGVNRTRTSLRHNHAAGWRRGRLAGVAVDGQSRLAAACGRQVWQAQAGTVQLRSRSSGGRSVALSRLAGELLYRLGRTREQLPARRISGGAAATGALDRGR